MTKTIALVFSLTSLAACGGSAPAASTAPQTGAPVQKPAAQQPPVASSTEPEAAEPTAQPAEQEAEEPARLEIPTECALAGAKVCTPPADFVARLCEAKSQELALSMFRKSTPWTRAYLRRNMEAWYTGVKLASPVQLTLDEEVIVVASRSGSSGGIQVSGSGSYDVYRWDGKCVSVMADEVTMRRPPIPGSAPIAWKALTEATRDALLDDRGIKFRRDIQRERCSEDGTAPRCSDATAALIQLIADYVRKGGKLPDARLTAR